MHAKALRKDFLQDSRITRSLFPGYESNANPFFFSSGMFCRGDAFEMKVLLRKDEICVKPESNYFIKSTRIKRSFTMGCGKV